MGPIKLIACRVAAYNLRRDVKKLLKNGESSKKTFREKYPNFPLYFSASAHVISLIAEIIVILKTSGLL